MYDGDGNLVKKLKPDGSRTLYVGGIYEVDKNSVGTVTGTKTYYPAAGAMRINNDVYYVLKDHLGSASVVTDASGNVVGEQRYYPFGETRFITGSMLTDKLFTGQREMADLGIYHYQARFYSPYINRFLSADTIVPDYANPQSLNRYSYVVNNPLRYTDPTGHDYTECGERSNYRCKIHMKKVAESEARGAAEAAAQQAAAQQGCTSLACIAGSTNPFGGVTLSGVRGGCNTLMSCSGNSGFGGNVTLPGIALPNQVSNSSSGGLRWPDYVSINVATGWPFSVVGVDIQVTRDYYNNWYISPGVYGGTPGATVFGAWLLQGGQPREQDMESFVGQHSIFLGGGYWGGGGVTWGRPFDGEFNWNDLAGEGGFSTPGGAGGWTYGILLYDNGDPTPWIWQGDR